MSARKAKRRLMRMSLVSPDRVTGRIDMVGPNPRVRGEFYGMAPPRWDSPGIVRTGGVRVSGEFWIGCDEYGEPIVSATWPHSTWPAIQITGEDA